MMSNYVIAVYVSSDPRTYMVRIRFTFQNRVWHLVTANKILTNFRSNVNFEREMCPWAISKVFWWLSANTSA
jgi:hypothetical protein